MEILSPSTGRRDRTLKWQLYRDQGVAEYWIVDPVDDVIERWSFGEEDPAESSTHRDRLPVRLGGRELGRLTLSEVFARDF